MFWNSRGSDGDVKEHIAIYGQLLYKAGPQVGWLNSVLTGVGWKPEG